MKLMNSSPGGHDRTPLKALSILVGEVSYAWVAELERLGYTERLPDPHYARVRRVTLTPARW
jgi:hypothetical protein